MHGNVNVKFLKLLRPL